ncbi:hypothetical protein Tsedi_00183 [Tepidimonas sediminis]|uniref:Uncharacterized protein n=1 Tax=Tepidimonas sediminis TaxID=2588941 RepID=A0A554WUU0_9BURK|nr:hypothetical protein [Tepidimonas sediminis]TSE27350.1 hypothetical protein Tsedi_00183 [Tepidimonas sediminis]
MSHSGFQNSFIAVTRNPRKSREAPSRTAILAREHRDIYAVVDGDGCIVTVGHRFRRVLRDRSLANVRPRGWRRSASRQAAPYCYTTKDSFSVL